MDTKYGPTLSPDAFEPPFDQIVADVVEDGQMLHKALSDHMEPRWRSRPLEILVVDNALLNARVCNKGDFDRIFFFRGTFEYLYGAMLGLLSTPTFLPTVGNVGNETLPKSLPDDRFPPVPLLKGISEPDRTTPLFIPNDETRTHLATVMADLALGFLMYHEIGHVVGGHFEIPRTGTETQAIAEFQYVPGDGDDIPFAQLCECDADAFACHTTAALHTHDEVAGPLCEILSGEGSQPKNFALLTYLASISVLFRLMYPSAPRKIGGYKSSHPHPAVRGCLVASATAARGLFKRTYSLESVDGIMADAVGSTEEVWASLCLSCQSPEGPDDWGKSVQDGAMSLFASYGQSRALFEKYARLPRRWDDWDWGVSGAGGHS